MGLRDPDPIVQLLGSGGLSIGYGLEIPKNKGMAGRSRQNAALTLTSITRVALFLGE